MSDRYNGFIVTFDQPIKDEYATSIKDAILMLKGVISVAPIVDDMETYMTRIQVYNELKIKIYKCFEEK